VQEILVHLATQAALLAQEEQLVPLDRAVQQVLDYKVQLVLKAQWGQLD
jgi:hypothetical protein